MKKQIRVTVDLYENVCPTCKGTGYVIYSAKCPEVYGTRDYEVDFATKCPACNGGLEQRVETAKKLSNVPVSFSDARYSSFDWNIYQDRSGKTIDMSEYRRLIEDFLKGYADWKAKGIGFYIFSKTKGSGKTFLASCICNELMEIYGLRAKFVKAVELLDISKSADKDGFTEYERDPIKQLCDCEVLVIDDIGQKKTGYDWMNEVLGRIVDERMTKKLVTIFTSNLPINELASDDRVIKRIGKMVIKIGLPEYDVRSREAYNEKLQFLKDRGLID